jgi:hypothetical protein
MPVLVVIETLRHNCHASRDPRAMKNNRLSAILMTALCATFLSQPAAAQTADPLMDEIKVFVADLAQGRACKWLEPFDEIAVRGKIADNAARVRVNFGAQAGAAADAAAKAQVKTDPCSTPADEQKEDQVTLLRLEWLARADTIYTVSESAPFGKDMTSLGATHALRREELEGMRNAFVNAAGAAQWNPVLDGIVKDARSLVGLACGDRINFKTKTPRKCPAIPDNAKKFIPLAVAQLKNIEAFAASIGGALKAPQPAP